MRIGLFMSTILLLLVPRAAVSATYYIDFASGSDSNAGTSKEAPWKRAPGMNGFAGHYAHSPGDRLIFKGGVTWDATIAKWSISESGDSGDPDYYGADKGWFAGNSWTKPIFDGGNMNPVASHPYFLITGSYVTLDNLQVQNIGVPGVNQGNYAIEFLNDHDITAQNLTLPVLSRIALYYAGADGQTHNNLTFKDNDISASVWGIGVGTARANTVLNNVNISNNRIHDFHLQMVTKSHTDGIIVYTNKDPGQSISGRIYNNQFYGDFSADDASGSAVTAFIFIDDMLAGTFYVYNNVGTYSKAGTGAGISAFIEVFGRGSPPAAEAYVYNNTMVGDEHTIVYFIARGYRTVVLQNNIFVGARSGVYIGDATTISGLTSDYNNFYGWALGQFSNLVGGARSINYFRYKSLGYETHGLNVNPLFLSGTDFRLRPTSRAIGAGINLSSVFTTDAAGNPRPSTGAWDLGAYQTTNPASKQGVKKAH